jgi:hypothetical protein
MGMSLFYQTTTPVSVQVRSEIIEDAQRINTSRPWWCESLHFFGLGTDISSGGNLELFGDTKVFWAAFRLGARS